MPKLTSQDINFIKNNYNIIGTSECAKKLNCSNVNIRYHLNKLGIKSIGKLKKKPEDYRVNPLIFSNYITKESSYILGLLWADGFLNNAGRGNRIILECLKEDIKQFLPVFYKTGKWSVYYRHRKNKKETGSINTNNKILYDFLYSNDYKTKNKSADKILKVIPQHLKYLFLLGVIDGDGCFYVGKSSKLFTISSGYNQNWNYVKNILNDIGIEYHIYKRKNITGNNSVIAITYKYGIDKLGQYIYQTFEQDKIGLNRKYLKWKELVG